MRRTVGVTKRAVGRAFIPRAVTPWWFKVRAANAIIRAIAFVGAHNHLKLALIQRGVGNDGVSTSVGKTLMVPFC